MSNIARFRIVLLCLVVGYSGLASAHAPGHSYVFLSVAEDGVTGRIEIPLDELERGLGDAGSQRSAATSVELNADGILGYVDDRFQIKAADQTAQLDWTSSKILEFEETVFAVLEYTTSLSAPLPEAIEIEVDFLVHELPEHRVGLVIEDNPYTGVVKNHTQLSYFFSGPRNTLEYHIAGRSLFERIFSFVYEGIIHIWLGFDHVLFLACLLLSAVVTRKTAEASPGIPVEGTRLKDALFNVVTIVTVFTVAHSITLALALKGWVTLPSRWVESIIALSVLAVAIDNVKPFFGRWKWTIVFLFGLFHGLGFASVLLDLGLEFQSKLVALVGFNIGVEVGQLAIVAVLFPLLFALRERSYRQFVLVPGSVAIGLISIWWLVSRVFEIESGWTSF